MTEEDGPAALPVEAILVPIQLEVVGFEPCGSRVRPRVAEAGSLNKGIHRWGGMHDVAIAVSVLLENDELSRIADRYFQRPG